MSYAAFGFGREKTTSRCPSGQTLVVPGDTLADCEGCFCRVRHADGTQISPSDVSCAASCPTGYVKIEKGDPTTPGAMMQVCVPDKIAAEMRQRYPEVFTTKCHERKSTVGWWLTGIGVALAAGAGVLAYRRGRRATVATPNLRLPPL